MSHYRVLARKYRPQTFADLVGQDVLVRTISNAIKMGRIAHAFLLTGIRGIGKTTTARIIARGLNCIGPDGQGGPTISPCGVCPNCIQILEDRHVDVMEMDAASRTGVGDVRDLIERVNYAPSSARYKVYIIDEVHMLSTAAFNALLKTLEEPPAHVIFIFATTEIRKIPVTILSRCQRFDLKRLDGDALADHLARVCEKESVEADEAALRLIALAAEGSVRDALSLLDRAIAHGLGDGEDAAARIDEHLVRGMLGLADRSRLFTVLESAFAGDILDALDLMRAQYREGMDMTMLFQDMLSLIHTITRLCLNKQDDLGPTYAQSEKEYAQRLAAKLTVGHLSRAWQIVLKGLEEVRRAPDALTAAEMVLIRFAYLQDLPDPTDLVRRIKEQQNVTPASPAHSSAADSSGSERAMVRVASGGGHADHTWAAPQPVAQAAGAHLTLAAHNPAMVIQCFEDVLQAAENRREAMLLHQLTCDVALVSCQEGELLLSPVGKVDDAFKRSLADFLQRVSDKPWVVRLERTEGVMSLAQQREAAKEAAHAEAMQHPLTQALLRVFPDAQWVGVESVSAPNS